MNTPATDPIVVSTDPARLDVEMVHRFLTTSYWARGITREVVERSIAGSLCFGVYERSGAGRRGPRERSEIASGVQGTPRVKDDGTQQVGFARVISDYATYAYIGDVFIIESHRGRGLSRRLMAAIMAHPRLQGLRRWGLVTRDAHGLYAQFGFRPLQAPERFMEIHNPNAYMGSS